MQLYPNASCRQATLLTPYGNQSVERHSGNKEKVVREGGGPYPEEPSCWETHLQAAYK